MSLFSLKDIRNHPRRSAFDLSSKVAFSAKSGELLPIKWYFTMPGDKFTLKRQHFTLNTFLKCPLYLLRIMSLIIR
jgi:hypothetical protein